MDCFQEALRDLQEFVQSRQPGTLRGKAAWEAGGCFFDGKKHLHLLISVKVLFFFGLVEKTNEMKWSEAESWHIELIEDFEFQLFLILLVFWNMMAATVPAFRWATCSFQQHFLCKLGFPTWGQRADLRVLERQQDWPNFAFLSWKFLYVHHWKLTWNPKNEGLEDEVPFQKRDFFRFHVSFLGCNQQQYDAVEPGIPGFCYRNLEYRSAPPKGGVFSACQYLVQAQGEVTGGCCFWWCIPKSNDFPCSKMY